MKTELGDVLADIVARAIGLGADAVEVEYKDRHEEITAMKGNVGFGIGDLPSESAEAAALRDELWKMRRKVTTIRVSGVEYKLKVSVFDSFGETAFRLEIGKRECALDDGAPISACGKPGMPYLFRLRKRAAVDQWSPAVGQQSGFRAPTLKAGQGQDGRVACVGGSPRRLPQEVVLSLNQDLGHASQEQTQGFVRAVS